MFAIKIDLLTGRYVATRFNDRNDTEWPPHPARLYSALVATWAETGADPGARAALTWFEGLDGPSISASPATRRSSATYYVPDADVRVADQTDRLYEQLTDKTTQITALSATIAQGEATPQQEKLLAKLFRELDKLRQTATKDSTKKAAANSLETASTIDRGLAVLPDNRTKQGRTFPTIIPESPIVHFIWPDTDVPDEHVPHLESLLHQVSRLGHSSSLVSCELADGPPPANLVPDAVGSQQIRVTAAGLLDELEASFARHQGNEPRSLPAIIQHYRLADDDSGHKLYPHPVLGRSWTVLHLADRPLPLSRTLSLTTAVRGALQYYGEDPLPELLTGHQPSTDGRPTPPSSRSHLAIVPLPFVGQEFADGGIRGIGLIFPVDANAADRFAVEQALARWSAASGGGLEVQLGRAGVVRLEIADPFTVGASLRERTWCRPSSIWVSATPVALDRFAGALWHRDLTKHAKAEQRAVNSVSGACEYIGLPRPRSVEILKAAPLSGVPGVRSFPFYESPGRKVGRQTVHVRVTFHEPIVGPVLLGAGRYFGYGLCFPADPRVPSLVGGAAALEGASL